MSHVGFADYYEPPDPKPEYAPTLEERLEAFTEDLHEYALAARRGCRRGSVSDRLALLVDDEYVLQLLGNIARAARPKQEGRGA